MFCMVRCRCKWGWVLRCVPRRYCALCCFPCSALSHSCCLGASRCSRPALPCTSTPNLHMPALPQVGAMKKLLAQLFGGTSPHGRKLRFRSAGWRGTQLVLEVSHEAAGAASVAGGASVGEAGEDEASQAGQQRSAGGGSWVQTMSSAMLSAAVCYAQPSHLLRRHTATQAACCVLADLRLPAVDGTLGTPCWALPLQVAPEVVELLDDDIPPFPFPQDTNPDGESLDVHGLSTKGCRKGGWILRSSTVHVGSLHTMYYLKRLSQPPQGHWHKVRWLPL